MRFNNNSHRGRRLLLAVGVLLATVPLPAHETNLFSAGVRAGVSSSNNSIWQYEGFLNRDLPWVWSLGRQWRLWPRLELTSGTLVRSDEFGYVGSLGPSLVIGQGALPVSANIGCRPTGLSRYTFGERDLGIRFQITSHVGMDWRVHARWEVGYRFQHMSNGGMAKPNPGLNVHFVSAAFRF
ncbi:MAG: acyloxyacyl hydrolase [Verrucomicrobia bacterium]|nr:acyloxyacyl hydrolase [Verrucomicrobiota bacterium]